MKDPEFLAEAKGLGFDVDPVLGEKMQRIVEKVLATPKDVAAKANVASGPSILLTTGGVKMGPSL